MEDNYVYIAVKLYLESGQTEQSVREIIQEADCSFDHGMIIGTEIVDVIDMQVSGCDVASERVIIDPFDNLYKDGV